MREICVGSCDGTGAAINVCLGWIPDFVMIFNIEDAGAKMPVVTWVREMSQVSALDEGFLMKGVSDTDMDRTLLTADGISVYNSADELVYDGTTDNRWELLADDTDATEVFVDGHHRRSTSGQDAYACIGDTLCPDPKDGAQVNAPDGFTIGADTDLNADGEQLVWLAIRV